jgi:hypothetical protein
MMQLLNAEFLPGTAIRRYQHPTLGVLVVQTLYGTDGSADLIRLHAAVLAARLLRRMRAGEDVLSRSEVERQTPSPAPRRKRQPRPRPPRGTDTKPSA